MNQSEKWSSRDIRRNYRSLLNRIEWHRFCDHLISERAACWNCSSCEDLQVHHLVYRDCMPWEYAGDEVRVLCRDCHRVIHMVADLAWVELLHFEPHQLEIILKRIREAGDGLPAIEKMPEAQLGMRSVIGIVP